MVKKLIDKMRVQFKSGKQKEFLEKTQEVLGLNNDRMAELIGVHSRSFRDWKREKFLVPLFAIKKLCTKLKIPIPKNITLVDQYWYAKKGARIGGIATYQKYGSIGDPEVRKKKWQEWWNTKGVFKKQSVIGKTLPFRKPAPSKMLAEFFGIMLGDGGMSRYQVHITLHNKDDLLYSKFVRKMMQELFGIKPAITKRPNFSVNVLIASRVGMVQYLHSLGLVIGNKIKQEVDIPAWIKENKEFQIACMRGLVDTDGCIFQNNYKVNGKWYHYKKLAFTSASLPLRNSVFSMLKDFGFSPSITQSRDVRLNSKTDMKHYFELIGSHNQKHLEKWRSVVKSGSMS